MKGNRKVAGTAPRAQDLKRVLERIVPEWMRHAVRVRRSPYRGWTMERVFREIYTDGRWRHDRGTPPSGPGSSLPATEPMRSGLQAFLARHRCRSIVDIGCGDFTWMSALDLTGIDYRGFDIVPELIAANQGTYGSVAVRFEVAPAAEAPIGACDLLLCRDCLVHLSFADIGPILRNIEKSSPRFVALTHFPGTTRNTDVPTGLWRSLNLTLPPFDRAPPDEVIADDLGQSAVERVLAIWRATRSGPAAPWPAPPDRPR